MLDEANKFISSLSQPEQVRYGFNIYLLGKLIKENLIYYTDISTTFRELIESKKERLTKIDPLTFIKDSFFDIDEYLEQIDTEVTLAVTEEFEEDFNEVVDVNFLQQNQQIIGTNSFFSFELNILDGRYDYAQKIRPQVSSKPAETPNNTSLTGEASSEMPLSMGNQGPLKEYSFSKTLHRIDNIKENSSWPYTQMWKKSNLSSDSKEMLPFFAFTGFSRERIKKIQEPNFDETGFFFEIANNNIQHMVAIGLFGPEEHRQFDFPPYFLLAETYSKKDSQGNTLRKVTVSLQKSTVFSSNVMEYVLECTLETYDPETQQHTKKLHPFTVFNIPIKDGTPLNLDRVTQLKLFSLLLTKATDGINIGVHCRAGRGRTGELLMVLIALYTGRYKQIFSGNIVEEIRDFVLELREQRAGMPLEQTQLLQAIQYIIFMMNIFSKLQQISPKKLTEETKTPERVTPAPKRTLESNEEETEIPDRITSIPKRKLEDKEEETETPDRKSPRPDSLSIYQYSGSLFAPAIMTPILNTEKAEKEQLTIKH